MHSACRPAPDRRTSPQRPRPRPSVQDAQQAALLDIIEQHGGPGAREAAEERVREIEEEAMGGGGGDLDDSMEIRDA